MNIKQKKKKEKNPARTISLGKGFNTLCRNPVLFTDVIIRLIT